MRRLLPMLLITRREVFDRLESFSYRASTLFLMLIAAAGVVALNGLPGLAGDEDRTRLGVVTSQGPPRIQEALQATASELRIDLTVVPFLARDAAEESLRLGEVEAVLASDSLVFRSAEDAALRTLANRAVQAARLPLLLDDLGLSLEQARPLISPAPVDVVLLEPASAAPEDEDDRRGLAAISAVGLYISLTLYGNWILQGVVEEKTSRVAEVLLGLVSAGQLLAGKTLGILLVALLQLAATLAGGFVGLLIAGGIDLPALTPDVALAAAVYFILGLLLYSLMFAAVGSTVNRQSEAQSAAMPVTLLLLVPYIISVFHLPARPDSGLSVLMSLLPVSSPLIMPGRIAVGSPSVLEVAFSLAMLVASLGVTIWLAGRIYASAMLINRRVSVIAAARSVLAGRRPE